MNTTSNTVRFAAATILAAAMSCLFAVSCNKEAASSGIPQAKVFTVTIEMPTKTTLAEGKQVYWEPGDAIAVNRDIAYMATTVSGTTAIFSLKDPDKIAEGPYSAFYPRKFYNGSNSGQYYLPETQIYEEGRFEAPMYARSNDERLQFKNICGVLCFSMRGLGKVRRININTDYGGGEFIRGGFDMVSDVVMTLNNEKVDVTLDCGSEGVQLNLLTPTAFYIYLPPQTYKAGMLITVEDTEGKKYTKQTAKDVIVERNTIYDIKWKLPVQGTEGTAIAALEDGSRQDVPWVQLWENGPRFAKYNIGVKDGKPESFGEYFEWDSAVATKVWGGNWRMPSRNEMEALISNCTAAWTTVNNVDGMKFTGNGTYSRYSIFLPAAGRKDWLYNNDGNYWTSANSTSGYAFALSFTSGGNWYKVHRDNDCDRGYTVRAVVNQ